jgi:hypothetical protein
LSALLSRVANFPSRKPSRPLPSSAHTISVHKKSSIIGGCVVGGIAFVTFFTSLYKFCSKKRRETQHNQPSPKTCVSSATSNQSQPRFELPAQQVSEIAERTTIKSPQELADKETYLTAQSSASSNTPPSPAARLAGYEAPNYVDGAHTNSGTQLKYVEVPQSVHGVYRQTTGSPLIPPLVFPESHCYACGSPTSPVTESKNYDHGMYNGSYSESMTHSYHHEPPTHLVPEPLNVVVDRERMPGRECWMEE